VVITDDRDWISVLKEVCTMRSRAFFSKTDHWFTGGGSFSETRGSL
jgi:hypothetical protein